MRAAIVAGAPFEPTALVLEALRRADLLIAADSGAAALVSLGLSPSLVIGDMDSIEPGLLDRLRAGGVETVVEPAERKTKTDTHLAILAAIERGADDVAVVGGLGGERLDHALANVLLLGNEAFAVVSLRLIAGHAEAHVVRRSVRLRGATGEYVSLLPLSDEAGGVTTDGLKYALADAVLYRADSLGVSNEMVAPEASVQVGVGVLLVVHVRGPQ